MYFPDFLTCRKSVLQNFAIFTEKRLCWSLFFNTVAGLRTCSFMKRNLKRRCVTVNISKFYKHLPTTASSGLGCGRKGEESFPLLCLFTSLFYLLILQLYYFKLQDISLRSSEAMLYISPGFVKYHGEENLLSTNIKTRNIW